MREYIDNILQEIDSEFDNFDFYDCDIIENSLKMVRRLRDILDELNNRVKGHTFNTKEEEVMFFKHQKPALLGRLIYFHKILRIESQRPFDTAELDKYYKKQQEEQKLFFDRHVAFFQYYRSGSTHLDAHYFLRRRQDDVIDVDRCPFDEDFEFSTGYDSLVARIVAMEKLYAFLSFRRARLQYGQGGSEVNLFKVKGSYQWTGSIAELVELIYGLDELKCINNGETPINELAMLFGTLLGVDIRDCYGSYVYLKKRKNDSRTYFLDKMREQLNKRMERDDEKERKRRF